MSDKDAREEARFQLLEESRVKLGTLLIPNSRTGSLRRARNEDTGWFCDWLTRYEALLAAESHRTQAPSEQLEELEHVLADWNALVKAVGSPTNGGAVGHAIQLNLKVKELTEKLAGTQAQAAQWISVEDKLPDIDIKAPEFAQKAECLVMCSMGVVPAIYERAAYAKTEKRRICRWKWYGFDRILDGVTHWQPLPGAPVAALEGNGEKK